MDRPHVALALLLAALGIGGLLLFAPAIPDAASLRADLTTPQAMGHVAIFAVVALILPHALPRLPRLILWEMLLLAAGAAELVQYLVPGRDPSWADLVANALGTLAVWVPVRR